ncbi:rhomboid family intramembrane serine protease [Bacteroidales bacterium]|nr:rhomboid family intramembrane serine protease [Bacteroidales bacterium]
MGNITGRIEYFFKQKSVLSNLIFANILVFIILRLGLVLKTLFNIDIDISMFLELSSNLELLFARPWSIVSYMFVHLDFLHLLFNMLWLYWFGQIFLSYFNSKQLGGLYLIGGIAGASFFLLAYLFIPYFKAQEHFSSLIGASASVMAIVFASAFYNKSRSIHLLFLGEIKIIYIAIFSLLIDIFAMTSTNAGGHIAHLGGAFCGITYAQLAIKGHDLTKGINKMIDLIANLFKKKKVVMKVSHHKRFESDYEYNSKKNKDKESVDKILDKIKISGYDSLTASEKKQLFDASNEK